MKIRIKSKSFSRIKSRRCRRHNERSFPESFSIFICLLFALFIIEKCFLLRYCYWLQLFSCFSSTSSHPSRLFRLCFDPPSPRLISSDKHPHKYISILKLDTQKSFLLLLLLLLLVLATRYLNFILMFVPSINFYNPFINLIKTKHTESSLAFRSFSFHFPRPSLFPSGNFYRFSGEFRIN